MIERRDSRGCFIKGNVPWNKSPRGIIFTCKFCHKQKPDEMKVAMRFFPPLPVCRDCWELLERGATQKA